MVKIIIHINTSEKKNKKKRHKSQANIKNVTLDSDSENLSTSEIDVMLEIEKANIIKKLRERYHCIEHNQPCYININTRSHLCLLPHHLSLWAHDIV